jgi:hypothetical protein
MKKSPRVSEFETRYQDGSTPHYPVHVPWPKNHPVIPSFVTEPADKVAGRGAFVVHRDRPPAPFDFKRHPHLSHEDLPVVKVTNITIPVCKRTLERGKDFLVKGQFTQVFEAHRQAGILEEFKDKAGIDFVTLEVPPVDEMLLQAMSAKRQLIGSMCIPEHELRPARTPEEHKQWHRYRRHVEEQIMNEHWDQHSLACEMTVVTDGEGTRFSPSKKLSVDVSAVVGDIGGFRFPHGIRKVTHGPAYSLLFLVLILLTGCQGWMHGAEMGLHGPDPRIEKAHRATHKAVIDLLEADFQAVEEANVIDPRTGKASRANLEKQFKLLRQKSLQIKAMDKLMFAMAAYNGVDLNSKPGKARSEAGKRAKQLRDLLEDVAKEQGKDLGDDLLDGMK